jgi:hypothetical protein
LGEQLVYHIKLPLGFTDCMSSDFNPLESGLCSLQILLDSANSGHGVSCGGLYIGARHLWCGKADMASPQPKNKPDLVGGLVDTMNFF